MFCYLTYPTKIQNDLLKREHNCLNDNLMEDLIHDNKGQKTTNSFCTLQTNHTIGTCIQQVDALIHQGLHISIQLVTVIIDIIFTQLSKLRHLTRNYDSTLSFHFSYFCPLDKLYNKRII